MEARDQERERVAEAAQRRHQRRRRRRGSRGGRGRSGCRRPTAPRRSPSRCRRRSRPPCRPGTRPSCRPVANAAANSGASVETEPSISPARPGWTIWSTNARARSASLLAVRTFCGSCSRSSSLGQRGRARLDLGQVDQELADAGVGHLLGGLAVEVRRSPAPAPPPAAAPPRGPAAASATSAAAHEAAHVLAPDQRDVLAELARGRARSACADASLSSSAMRSNTAAEAG